MLLLKAGGSMPAIYKLEIKGTKQMEEATTVYISKTIDSWELSDLFILVRFPLGSLECIIRIIWILVTQKMIIGKIEKIGTEYNKITMRNK